MFYITNYFYIEVLTLSISIRLKEWFQYGKETIQNGIETYFGSDGEFHLHSQGDLPP